MYLTRIALDIEQALLDSTPDDWPGDDVVGHYVVPDDMNVSFALDPFTESGNPQTGIYCIPGVVQWRIDRSRKSHLQNHLKFITVALCFKFKETDSTGVDISSREEAIKIINLREDLDRFLMNLDIGIKLEEINNDTPDLIQLRDRYFLTVTELGYATC